MVVEMVHHHHRPSTILVFYGWSAEVQPIIYRERQRERERFIVITQSAVTRQTNTNKVGRPISATGETLRPIKDTA